jgi:hypothetical protein
VSRQEVLGPNWEVNVSGKDGDAGGEGMGEGEDWEKKWWSTNAFRMFENTSTG